jgi:hypothetical protein
MAIDEAELLEALGAELIDGWDVAPTGDGFLITTDWSWPNRERIEIFVRRVGEREDLFIVTDGGELFNLLFTHGFDPGSDHRSMDLFRKSAENHGAEVVEGRIVKGANAGGVAVAVREILEAVKDISFLLWHKITREQNGKPV